MVQKLQVFEFGTKFGPKMPIFGQKNADVIKNAAIMEIFFTFSETTYGVLVLCQKWALYLNPIKNKPGGGSFYPPPPM